MLLPDSEGKLQPAWATSEMEFLPRWSHGIPGMRGGGGCPRGEERHCSCKEGERQVITFLLEMEGVTALRGEKNPDMSMQLPVVLPENGREKRYC